MSRARDFADLAGSADAGGLTGKNLVINGSMQVFQRATAATAAAGGYETADRFIMGEVSGGAYTTERSTDHPTSSGYSLKAQVTTADTSISAAHYAYIFHKIEAQNLQHLAYGTSSAKTLTLSFFVKSNKTGTYTVNLYKPDGTGYIFVQEYTIDSADTWEKKTITISPTAGSTSFITASAGAIANDNGSGLEVGFSLAWGSNYTGATSGSWSSNTNHYATTNQVNWLDSTSNNLYLTQIQLEVGDKATPFEHRSFGEELSLCQRYYQQSYDDNTVPGTVTNAGCMIARASSGNVYLVELTRRNIVTMRTTPSVVSYSPNTGTVDKVRTSGGDQTVSGVFDAGRNSTGFPLMSGSVSDGDDVRWHFTLSAEL